MNRRSFLTSSAALLLGTGGFGVAFARHDHGTPDASPMAGHAHGDGANLSMGAAYLTITNNGDDADRLVSLETDMAQAVEIHDVTIEDNVMEMTPLHDGLEIPAGESVSLEPGDFHIMLIGITKSLVAGEHYDLTLTFENAGDVTVTVPILRGEPEGDEEAAGPVEVGDLVISDIWSRQAPKIDSGMSSPTASPGATPAH